jgi:predicted O-linked N-acetylglucosamine transferase (SPINDLY family)
MTPNDSRLEFATARHRSGDLIEARRLYRQVLAESPANTVAGFRLGLLEMQEGRLDDALRLVQNAIASSPNEAKYRSGLGEILTAMQRWDEAAAAYQAVLAIEPESADAFFSLGGVLQSQGKYDQASDAYRAVVRIKPDFADALSNLGNCQKLMGDLVAAESSYRKALQAQPNHTGAMSNLATVLQSRGDNDQAIELLRAAMALDPGKVIYALNLGVVLCQQRRYGEAEPVLRAALMREPNNAKTAYNLGNALHGLGRLSEAAELYRAAIALRPDYAGAMNNLGNVCKEMGEFKAAAQAYESAMQTRPNFIPAINNAGVLLRTMGRLEEAEAILRRGLVCDVNHPALHENLGNVLKDSGRLDEAIDCFRHALQLDPTATATQSNLAYSLSFSSEEPQPILEECIRWNQLHAEPLRPKVTAHSNDRSPDRRLHIGYVSPDFRDHCQSLFTIPLLSHHDHGEFETFCYSSVERPDAYTQRIRKFADVWREVRHLDDSAVADLIRADGIDILIDLTMHMANGRPLVFSRKPAQVQIAWLAYPGTTGMSAMDYRFSDPRLDPPGYERHYSERTEHLPDSFWCYDPLADGPEVNELPALSQDGLTLGCLNNPCKLSDHTLRLWAGVMQALPDSRLLLLVPPGSYREQLLGRFASLKISADRVSFVPFRRREEYLRTYHQIDLGLDTFPYNGHTTSLDSLWMGVAVVTRVGKTCVGRAGLSQLFQLGLAELATETDEAFVDAAVSLASDLPRLGNLRRQLRGRLCQSPLMDGERFAKNIESAYRRIWHRYCDGANG